MRAALKKNAMKALFLASALAAGVFSQSLDTAKVPVRVNVAATVEIQPLAGSGGVGALRSLTANKVDTLVIRLPKTTSVSHNRQARAGVPALVRGSAGKVSLNLPARIYGNAEISLYSVNGKRVLRDMVSALNDVNNISRANIAAGAYLLSVAGINGNSFTARHTHGGGSLNIGVAFGDEGAALPLRKEANSLAGGWTLTASATGAGYGEMSPRDISPVKGRNPEQYVRLSRVGRISCDRSGLEVAVDTYLTAFEAGDHSIVPLAANARYIENDHDAKQTFSGGKMTYDRAVPFGDGLWKTPLKPDFHRNLIDVTECAAFTEIIVADTAKNRNPKQYVLGARLKVTEDKVSEISLVVTQAGDWGFNAANYLRYSMREDWSELPAAQRRTREQLRSDGYAYFAYFTDKNAPAPWATPCARLEGGAYTGDGGCNVGIPDGTSITPVSYLADVDYGMVVVFMYFGGADSHWFRILPAGYRYIHTLTAMKQSDYVAP
ncbi:MAG: T9SS type A sorting domain-containing protein [Chitinispirillales bacterium]|jgi:hypothetical protein|nr:T9SS type A sorting domain-containing protein [Chitinispirillales bacterium]